MKLAHWISAPFAQPTREVTPVAPKINNAPVMIAMPSTADLDAIFRSTLLKIAKDGCDLIMTMDAMITRHPAIATQVLLTGVGGGATPGSMALAIESLRIFEATGVAMPPSAL